MIVLALKQAHLCNKEMNEKIPDIDLDDNSEIWKTWAPREYISNMLHELRTPIMIIKGYAAHLSNDETKELHPKAIEGISHAADRLDILLNDYGELPRLPHEKI